MGRMIFLQDVASTSALRLLFFALILWNTSATVCEGLTLSNQEQVDTQLAGCTSINGTIYISSDYTGPFVLYNITSITGEIRAKNEPGPRNAVTSIIVKDVVEIGAIYVSYAPLLTSISFPDLSTVGNIDVRGTGGASLDFPSLTTLLDSTTLSDYISSVNFPRLEHIVGDFNMGTYPGAYLWDDQVQSSDYPPVDIKLPVLQNASAFRVGGNIRNLSVPLLSTVPVIVQVVTLGDPLDIDMPNLSNTSTITLIGTIQKISLPSLLSTGNFDVLYRNESDVSLAPLQTVDRIRLLGNIKTLSMSSIRNISHLSVESKLPLDCSPAMSAWTHANNSAVSTYFKCEGYVPPKKHLSLGGKISMGIGIPMGVFLISCLLWRWRSDVRKSKAAMQPGYNLDAPPKYYPSAVDAAADERSENSLRDTHSVDRSVNLREAVPSSRV